LTFRWASWKASRSGPDEGLDADISRHKRSPGLLFGKDGVNRMLSLVLESLPLGVDSHESEEGRIQALTPSGGPRRRGFLFPL